MKLFFLLIFISISFSQSNFGLGIVDPSFITGTYKHQFAKLNNDPISFQGSVGFGLKSNYSNLFIEGGVNWDLFVFKGTKDFYLKSGVFVTYLNEANSNLSLVLGGGYFFSRNFSIDLGFGITGHKAFRLMAMF